MGQALELSIIIPFYNEEGSLEALYDKLTDTLDPLGRSFEIIFVDDGSSDNSNQIAGSLQKKDSRIQLITQHRNSGKASALDQGFHASSGEIVFTMDADLQDDPKEIPSFLEKMAEGYDLVSGWKKKRFDPLEKKLPSKFFNHITSLVAGIKLHDFNCGFKAYRREVIKELDVYGDLHRFIPVLAHWKGFRVCEIPVQHHPRSFGQSKYGWKRYYQGFFDLFTVLLLTRFIRKPIYFFGLSGLAACFAGLCILIFITFLQVIYGSIMGHKPLSYLGVLSILLGSQMVASGLIAEMLINLKPEKKERFRFLDVFCLGKQETVFDQSIIIPIHNKGKSLSPFLKMLSEELTGLCTRNEIIFFANGSNDGSGEIIKGFPFPDNCSIKLICPKRSHGYAEILQAGDNFVSGDIIIMAIGMKNLPKNINRITSKLKDGIQIVKGRRVGMPRLESIFSVIINKLISLLTGVEVSDHQCGFYAFKKEIIPKISPHGVPLSFYPFIASKLENINYIEVNVPYENFQQVRLAKKLKCIFTDFLDVLVIRLTTDFMARPLHLFGIIGILIGMTGFFINFCLSMLKILTGNMGDHYTLLLIGITFMIIGVQWLTTGLLGEIINSIRQTEKNKENV